MQAPSREELLAGTADAEQVLEPGSWWHYSNLAFALLGEVVARADGGTWEEALQARVLDPLGLGRTTPAAKPLRPRAAISSSRTATQCGSSRTPISVAPAHSASSGRRPATSHAGARSSRPATTASSLPRRSRRWRTFERWSTTRAGSSRGARGWSSTVAATTSSSGTAAPCRAISPALVVNRKTKIGAAVLTNTGAGASPDKLALDLAVAAIEALPRRPTRGSRGGGPPEIEPLLGRWWVEGSRAGVLVAEGPARGEARRRLPGRDTSYFAARGRGSLPQRRGHERGELLRVVRDADGAIEKLYFATYRSPRAFDLLESLAGGVEDDRDATHRDDNDQPFAGSSARRRAGRGDAGRTPRPPRSPSPVKPAPAARSARARSATAGSGRPKPARSTRGRSRWRA